nr:MAG TPA: hypothetical protein [Caudoviricetes sp.]
MDVGALDECFNLRENIHFCLDFCIVKFWNKG